MLSYLRIARVIVWIAVLAGLGTAARADWQSHGGEWRVADGVLSVRAAQPAKAVRSDFSRADCVIEVEARVDSPKAQAGVIFRVGSVAAGIDRYHGYYAGIVPGERQAILGKAANNWAEIARRPAPLKVGQWYRLKLIVAGDTIRYYLNDHPLNPNPYPKFDAVDGSHKTGAVGLRALNGSVSFRNFTVKPYTAPKADNHYTNPVQPNGADPVVLRHDGVYYLYCTYSPDHPNMPNGIRLYTSTNLVDWTDRGYVLKRDDSWGEEKFWAPDVIEHEGKFLMYYAAETRICVAESDTPLGPFTQPEKKPMEPASIRIDAHIFQDDDGKNYLYYVCFNKGNEIWGVELNDDMRSVKSETARLQVKAVEPWETHMAPIAEGAEVLKHKGVYYMTYSGSHFMSPEYAVGYATARHPLGPWTKYEFNPIMRSNSYAHGTAHHCLTTSPDGSEMFIVHHQHAELDEAEPRKLAIDRIQFAPQADGPDALEVWGPTRNAQPMPSGARRNR